MPYESKPHLSENDESSIKMDKIEEDFERFVVDYTSSNDLHVEQMVRLWKKKIIEFCRKNPTDSLTKEVELFLAEVIRLSESWIGRFRDRSQAFDSSINDRLRKLVVEVDKRQEADS